MVGSYERERDKIFLRWLENVERLLGRRIVRDVAYKAWQDGYSVREYAGEMAVPPMTNDIERTQQGRKLLSVRARVSTQEQSLAAQIEESQGGGRRADIR
jgi:hypothetical protein